MAKTQNNEQVREPISIEAWHSINFKSLSEEERELKCQVLFGRTYAEAKHDIEMPWLVDALKTRSCIMDSWQSSVDANGMFEMHFVAYHVDVASFPFLSPGSSIEYNAPIQIQSFGGQTVSTYANAGAPYNFTVRLHPNDITDEFLSTLLEMYDMQYSFMGQQNPYERFASLVRHSRSEDCSV